MQYAKATFLMKRWASKIDAAGWQTLATVRNGNGEVRFSCGIHGYAVDVEFRRFVDADTLPGQQANRMMDPACGWIGHRTVNQAIRAAYRGCRVLWFGDRCLQLDDWIDMRMKVRQTVSLFCGATILDRLDGESLPTEFGGILQAAINDQTAYPILADYLLDHGHNWLPRSA